ncbi:hypothetical protein [Pseudomonas sp. PLMAX]|uniref:hypothetical protein n=1 Tax=Pseudomonas sp. PLMAX TaxID=2201998 RepID=UPI0038B88648
MATTNCPICDAPGMQLEASPGVLRIKCTNPKCYSKKRRPEQILSEALEKIIEMNRQYAVDKYGDAERAETMACVTLAREALKQAKEAQ